MVYPGLLESVLTYLRAARDHFESYLQERNDCYGAVVLTLHPHALRIMSLERLGTF